MEPLHIDDVADTRLDDYRALTDSRLRKLHENTAGVFIAEGPNPVRELLSSPYGVVSVLMTPERLSEHADIVDGLDPAAALYTVDRDTLYELVRFKLHQGVIAVGARPDPAPAWRDVVADARRVLILEAMNDHENMGALFRSARAFGFDAVLLGPQSADPLYRRSVRVSMGHVLHVPFAQTPLLPELLGELAAMGVTTVAADGRGDMQPSELAALDRVALVMGAEGPGITPETLNASERQVAIPIADAVDSLNVTVAASILMHAAAGPQGGPAGK